MASGKSLEWNSGTAKKNCSEAEKDEIEGISDIHGKYCMPNCIAVLQRLKDKFPFMDSSVFGFAIESVKDPQNRIIVMCLQHSMHDLIKWIQFKYDQMNK